MTLPLRIHPQNPKVFEFRGKPRMLVTATEHYGAVMNRAFRFERYLADAATRGITLTRLFVLFRELQSAHNPYSTCKVESTDYVAPWPRTGPGTALDGLPKYDLDRWNPEFFQRLHRFLSLASDYGIIVEVTLLSNTYAPEVWALNPLNPANNINGTEEIRWPDYLTMRHPELFRRQVAHVRQVVAETCRYDNILYEICNEPGGRAPGDPNHPSQGEVDAWQQTLARVIRETEAGQPHRHLVAGQEAFAYDPWEQPSTTSFREFPVDVVNVHPLPNTTFAGASYDMGAFMSKQLRLRAFRDYCLATYPEPKPLNLDEDNAASRFLDADGWTIHRKRAWTALLCGAHYDVIDFSIRPWLETGTPDSQAHLRTWMQHLSQFIHSVDLVRARPFPACVRQCPAHVLPCVLAVEGEDYAIYLADEREVDHVGAGDPVEGTLVLDVPPGAYCAECYSPVTGMASPGVMVTAAPRLTLALPAFRHDLVVRLRRA